MIKTVHTTTDDVAKELLRIAKQNATSASQLYIEISHIDTFVKVGDSDFVEMNNEDFIRYKQKAPLRDKNVQFEQEYEIEVNSKYKGYPFENMITEVEFEDNDTSAYLIIKKGSKLKYYDGLYNDFLDYITEQKLRSNIMLILFDINYRESIKQLVDVIQKVKTITFKEDKRFLISEGFNEIKSVSAEIYMTIEENNDVNSEDSAGRVDYSNRGFLLSCIEGEELFEFSKPFQGKHGRTCRGDLIEVETVNLDAKPTFTVEDSIEVQDSFENIKYLSSRSGYLVKKGNQYEVSNTLDVDEISFKTTGTINSDLDSEISINVIKDNPLEDAIEEGMHVKVQKLSITGSLGRNTTIEARDISITGQSHNDSSIKCVNANIEIHKGKVVGRTVKVERLEGGEIIADTAIVNNAISGKIRAKTIKIEKLGSYVTMESSEFIQIEKVRGEENKFIIDSLFHSGFDDKKEDDETYLKKLEDELKSLQKVFKELTLKVKNNLDSCKKIKSVIIKNKNEGLEIPSTLIQKFKTCRVMQVHYKKLKEELEYKKGQYEKLDKRLSSSGPDIFDAKIIVNEPLRGFNNIIYKLNNPPREIELNTNESMRDKIFKLTEDEDGVLKIVNVNK